MKKVKVFIVIILFVLSFLCHFIYEWFPNVITSVFFPVNESLWEHMKIIYTSTLIGTSIEYLIYRNSSIEYNNLLISIPIITFIGICLYLSFYNLITMLTGHNMFITLTLLLITYSFMQFVSYFILNSESIKYEKIYGVCLIIGIYIIFAYLTYNPPLTSMFLDHKTNTYGIKEKRKFN